MKKVIVIAIVVIPLWLFGQIWQRVLEESIDDDYLAGAYSGGTNYSKPYWIDIDSDNDYDLFIGAEGGGLHFYRNDGTVSSPSWTFVVEHFENIDVGNRSSQAFVDIDADGDYDLFIGEQWGILYYYRNEGTPNLDSFVFVTDNYEGIDVGRYSAPFFCDIDNDSDFDLFIGEHAGNINYYRNDGTPSSPSWTLVDETWFGIDVGTKNIPWFIDIDADADLDLFIGYSEGTTYFYRNEGTPSVPNMVYVTDNYISDVGNTNAPSFVDIDNDGDYDFFVGEYIGNTNFYRNTGTPSNASWSFIRRHYLTIDMNSSTTPVLVDIDADGDYDLFSGEWVGFIDYFKNTGTSIDPKWDIISENYLGIDVGDNSTPDFVDIDNDNDFDMFIGNVLGNIYYYRNDGSVTSPSFTFVSSNYNSIDVGDNSAPAFVDIDNDNDFDLFIGNLLGTIWYYRNDGTASTPSWTFITDTYEGIDIEERSNPTFADIDNDNDYDLFIGEALGTTFHYRNDGSASSPSFTFVTDAFADINVGENTAPAFIDINSDGDLDLFIGERWGGLNLWEQIPVDITPPEAPYIYGEKIGADAYFWWHPVTTDTAGNPENVSYYVIYRNLSPDFVPAPSDSIGAAPAPETTFTDIGAVNAGDSYYYLVKAVDVAFNRSGKSNMGFKFNKFLNENTAITDMNWVSLPYHNVYTTVSDISTEMSPNGTSFDMLTRLRDDQIYENWTYMFGMWLGDDFTIDKGIGYQFTAVKDTTPVFVGAHDPNFAVPLIENPTVTDMNWVSVPYNSVYNTASNITDEFSPSGDPLDMLTRLRDDQVYENWTYIFGMWLGDNFAIERGVGYQFSTIANTVWKPTVYTNRAGGFIARNQLVVKNMLKKKVYREPVWSLNDEKKSIIFSKEVNFVANELATHVSERSIVSLAPPHFVYAVVDLDNEDKILSELTFTAYCVDHPKKALFEHSVGCGSVVKDGKGIIWAEFGNLPEAWQHDEDAIVIVETEYNGRCVFGISRFHLDATQNPQYVGSIDLRPLPNPKMERTSSKVSKVTWNSLEEELNDVIAGYSVYNGDNRLNNEVLTECNYEVAKEANYSVRPIFIGGYETVLSSGKMMAGKKDILPHRFTFGALSPNPFTKRVGMEYALPGKVKVNIVIFDIVGRKVKTLVSKKQGPGYYSASWSGVDEIGRKVSSGIYFINFDTGGFRACKKVILVK